MLQSVPLYARPSPACLVESRHTALTVTLHLPIARATNATKATCLQEESRDNDPSSYKISNPDLFCSVTVPICPSDPLSLSPVAVAVTRFAVS